MKENYRAVLFVGPPWVGKSTQAKLIEPLGYAYISSGDLIRSYKPDPNTELGADVLESKRTESFISDMNIVQILDEHISAAGYAEGTRFIVDGFPRSVGQIAPASTRFDIEAVLYFQSHDDALLLGRPPRNGRPADADPAARAHRLREFYELTQPMLWHYGSRVHAIDATGTSAKPRSVEDVHADVLKVLRY